MMAGKTLELGKFWPGCRSPLPRPPRQSFQALPQGDYLPHGPRPASHTVAWSGTPMQWHHGSIGLEIKDQIRMTSRNQLMVNVADRISNVT
jgi:hypothetical protein